MLRGASFNLPDDLPQLLKLTKLNLSGNRIQKFNEGLADKLPELKELTLKENHLLVIPVGINQFTKLSTLELSQNDIEDLSQNELNFEDLVTLDLTNNKIKIIADNTFADLPALKWLLLKANPVIKNNENQWGLAPGVKPFYT